MNTITEITRRDFDTLPAGSLAVKDSGTGEYRFYYKTSNLVIHKVWWGLPDKVGQARGMDSPGKLYHVTDQTMIDIFRGAIK